MDRRNLVLSTVILVAMLTTFILLSHGYALDLTFVPAALIAYGLHLASTHRRAPSPERVLPIYLICLAWQFVHFTEEFATGFGTRWPRDIFHAQPFGSSLYVAINLWSYAAFALGALALFKGWQAPMIIVWFFAIQGTIGNAVGHVVWSLIVRGYFPGLYTSLLYWPLGWLLCWRLWRSSRLGYRESRPAEVADTRG